MIKLLKGFIIGISFTIPGVCSALTAMILSVYEELLEITGHFYKPKVLIKNLFFIIGVILGIVFAVITLSFLFKDYRGYLIIYFFGLALGGFIAMLKKVSFDSVKRYLFLILGMLVSAFPIICHFKNSQNSNLLVISISGFISSLAFIMPGISGSMLLLAFGVYEVIINALSNTFCFFINGVNSSIIIVLTFLVSFSLGTIFFSKIIKKILSNYEQNFLLFSLGLLIGTVIFLFVEIVNIEVSIFIILLISILGILTTKVLGE